MHRIVVVGGGVAGIVTATHLSRRLMRSKLADILLIDHNLAHVWKPKRCRRRKDENARHMLAFFVPAGRPPDGASGYALQLRAIGSRNSIEAINEG